MLELSPVERSDSRDLWSRLFGGFMFLQPKTFVVQHHFQEIQKLEIYQVVDRYDHAKSDEPAQNGHHLTELKYHQIHYILQKLLACNPTVDASPRNLTDFSSKLFIPISYNIS